MSSPETDIEHPDNESQEKPKLTLDVHVDKPSACQRHVTVTIAQEDVQRYFDEAFSELMPKASVPGFRAGRAPRKLVEQRFRSHVEEQVKGSLLMDSMTQISEDFDFSAISEPDFDFEAIEIPEDGPLKFEFDLEVRPEFDMPKWKGLNLERLTRDYAPEDVNRRIEQIFRNMAELTPHDGPAKPMDFVTVNIRALHQGKIIAEHEEVSVWIKPILSFPEARLEGFDKLMDGAKAGDKKTADVTISHDASAVELQGETVNIEFEVLEIKKLELPNFEETEVLKMFDCDTVGELRDTIKSDLERQLEYQQQRRIRQQITALLTQSVDWELPPDLVRRQSRREMDRAILELRRSGFSEDEIRAYENELRQNSLATTKTALQEHFILERIAEDETIEAEPQDYEAEIALIARQGREPIRRVRARIEKKGLMDALRNQIIERKVIELIQQHAEFKDVKYEPEKNETEAIDVSLTGTEDSEIPEAKYAAENTALQQPVDRT
jgi:trigger factor